MAEELDPVITADDVIRAGACAGGVKARILKLGGKFAAAMAVSALLTLLPATEHEYVLKAASLDGYGDGYGYGDGDGYGYGYGYGYGDGDGYGYGDGDGDGYGYGYGYGDGDGDGYGYGDGYGDGDGSGDGSSYA